MSLSPGTKLGPYEIAGALGAGGMGEVYRARDTRLNRDVAIKVLPEVFTLDPDRLARFTREAQILATLNHTNIAHVHGLEALPNHGSALMMELGEGQDLSEIIVSGWGARSSPAGCWVRSRPLLRRPWNSSTDRTRWI